MTRESYMALSLRTRILFGSLYFGMGVASVGLAVVLYWAFTGRNALVVTNAPLPVNPVVVKSQQTIYLTVSFCKYTTASGRVIRRLVSDKTELLAPTINEAVGPGCYTNLPVPVPIPPQTPPGRYHVNYRITYDTNPLHHGIIEEFNSKEFLVTE